jgi:hypothetical protein
LKSEQQCAIDGAEKSGHTLDVENVNELVGRPVWAAGAERLVGELRERRPIVRRVDHAIQLGLLPSFLRRLELARAPAQHARQVQGLLDFERNGLSAIGRYRGQLPLDVLLQNFRIVGCGVRHGS